MVKNKVIVVLGTTASGKTKLAVALAKKFNGEIISADSRQVYRGMDIGTGKDLSEYKLKTVKILYHLIDVADPKKQFTVAEWRQLALAAINDIWRRGKVPIICGGTGLYISALVEGYMLAASQISNSQSQSLRRKLEQLSLKQLLARLKKIDPKTYEVIDKNNRRRVQRALEIFYETGRPKSAQLCRQKPPYDFLLLGVTFPRPVLAERISRRLMARLEKEGMIKEIKDLHSRGVSWRRLEDFGLEYRYIARYLEGKISSQEMIKQLDSAIRNFAKRQMTWFKRQKKIIWLKDKRHAAALVKSFLKY